MIEASVLRETDVSAMIRLLGEVIAAPGDIHAKRRLLMDGLCRLIGVDTWVWCMCELDPDKAPSFIGLIHAGFDEERFARYLEAMNHPDMEPVIRPSSIEMQVECRQITRALPPADFAVMMGDSPAMEYWHKANIGPIMTSVRPMPGGGNSGIGIYRSLGAAPFDAREAKIAHIILSEVPWLHFNAFPDQASQHITELHPRHRTVLNLLGDGWSRKKIAEHLGISLNTVHGYARDIYKHFGVNSQAEFISRFTKGDGGDGGDAPR